MIRVDQSPYTYYPAPGGIGKLDIVAVANGLMTVTAVDSLNHETFVFDLRSH